MDTPNRAIAVMPMKCRGRERWNFSTAIWDRAFVAIETHTE
jgi:hypothetical protein